MTQIIDGKAIAASICENLAVQVSLLPRKPHLVAILVGDDPASRIYVNRKEAMAKKVGIKSTIVRLPENVSQDHLLTIVRDRNYFNSIDGILVQLPLPRHIDTGTIIEAIDPDKDVDGFHPMNAGRLMNGNPTFVPCTTMGIMRLLDASGAVLEGANAVMVGAGAVGKPTALMLAREGATVTMTHSKTGKRNLQDLCDNADIIVAAAGRPHLVRGGLLKRGVTVIDVGINRLSSGQIVGDVAFDECIGIAGAITPVPGGVGPMTIACLLENTVQSFIRRNSYYVETDTAGSCESN